MGCNRAAGVAPTIAESVYYVDYQGMRIISLNSNEQQDLQVPWLERVLANNPNRWTVCTFHHPIFSTGKGRDNPALRAAWQPIFDKYKVDLVLTGHDHTYGRTGLETVANANSGDRAQSMQGGTVYVVSVSGPKMYNVKDDLKKMKRTAEDTQLYQVIHVDKDQLRYEARTAVGELYDAFTLKKQDGKVNELVDEIPNTPARLRLAPAAPAKKNVKPTPAPKAKSPVIK